MKAPCPGPDSYEVFDKSLPSLSQYLTDSAQQPRDIIEHFHEHLSAQRLLVQIACLNSPS